MTSDASEATEGPVEPEEAAEQSEPVERTVLEDLVELAVTEEPADSAEHMVLIAPEALEEAMGMRQQKVL